MLMFGLALLWTAMHGWGRGTLRTALIAFGPFAGVLILLAFILGLELGINHKGQPG